jgi:formate transporter
MNFNRPADVSTEFRYSAVVKSNSSWAKLVVYGVLGGSFISLGALLAAFIGGGLPGIATANPAVVKLMSAAVFPIGLIMIVIGGAQLFTSDCAVLPYGVLSKKVTWQKMLSVWAIIYLSNFVGALLIAYLFAFKAELLTAEPWKSALHQLAVAKTSATFVKVFIKGIGANWLVCMAVWMSFASKDVTGKILAMWFPVMCFVALGFEHSIANMFTIPAAIFTGASVGIQEFFIGNLLPSTLGNIIGGAVFTALPYWYLFSTGDGRKAVVQSEGPVTIKHFENHLN